MNFTRRDGTMKPAMLKGAIAAILLIGGAAAAAQ